MRLASLPLAYLDNLIVFQNSLLHYIYFSNGIADWFLNVSMLAGFKRIGKDEAMPVIGCAIDYYINVLVLEQIAIIHIKLRFRMSELYQIICTVCENILIDVAQGYAFNVGIFQERNQIAVSLAVGANKTNPYLIGR
jgi:hypothetical protein